MQYDRLSQQQLSFLYVRRFSATEAQRHELGRPAERQSAAVNPITEETSSLLQRTPEGRSARGVPEGLVPEPDHSREAGVRARCRHEDRGQLVS